MAESHETCWTISEIDGETKGLMHLIVQVVATILFSIFIIMMIGTSKLPFWIKVSIEVGIIIVMFNMLLMRTAILSKSDNTVTIYKRLFDLWTVTQNKESLSNYCGVRISGKSSGRSFRLLVDLVTLNETTLTLKEYSGFGIEDARRLRNSVAEWGGLKVMYDRKFLNIK